MTGPKRIQRRRTKGWRMPEGAVYVGRGYGSNGQWGNPYRIGHRNPHPPHQIMTREDTVELFAQHLRTSIGLQAKVAVALRGKDLACWCPLDQPCHADVLLKIATGGDE